MGINFAYARKKFSEAQQKLRKEYKAAGMTDEQILEMYEYDLHQFNRDLAYQRHTQRLGILEEPDMEEEGYNPLLHKFIDALTVYQQPTGAAKLWFNRAGQQYCVLMKQALHPHLPVSYRRRV